MRERLIGWKGYAVNGVLDGGVRILLVCDCVSVCLRLRVSVRESVLDAGVRVSMM